MEIQLRPTGSQNVTPNAYVILGARQQLLSVPYSVRSLNATNSQNAVNATNATNATNAANAQTAVNSQQLGGVAADQFVQRGGVGTVKAMAEVNADGTISKCYNSTLTGTAATTVPCGISVNHFTNGGYGINFGFNAQNNFVAATLSHMRVDFAFEKRNGMIRYENGTGGNIDVRMAQPGDPETTTDGYFTIIIF